MLGGSVSEIDSVSNARLVVQLYKFFGRETVGARWPKLRLPKIAANIIWGKMCQGTGFPSFEGLSSMFFLGGYHRVNLGVFRIGGSWDVLRTSENSLEPIFSPRYM